MSGHGRGSASPTAPGALALQVCWISISMRTWLASGKLHDVQIPKRPCDTMYGMRTVDSPLIRRGFACAADVLTIWCVLAT